MPIIGLLLFVAAASGGSTADADAANLAFTQCLFATSRAASGERLSVSAFEQRLGNACLAEQRAAEDDLAGVLASRGDPAAASTARQLARHSREQVVDSYRRALELAPEFEKVAAMCKAHPDQCRY